METNGFKKRLKEALNNSQKIKILFQYPASDRIFVKKGFVLSINEDSFDFQDRYEGELTFSYNFIIEISNWGDEDETL